MAKIDIYDGDDWCVVVKDGERWGAGHERWEPGQVDMLKDLGHKVTYRIGMFEDGDDTRFVEEGKSKTIKLP